MIDARFQLFRSDDWEPPADPIRYRHRVNGRYVSMLPRREATKRLSDGEVSRRLNHHRMAFGFQ